MHRKAKITAAVVVLGLVLWTTPAHGFVAAWIQRALIIAQQLTQIGNQVEQIKDFKAKLDKMREQVEMVKDMKDSVRDGLNALKGEFTSLVTDPVDLVGDTMNWGSEFKGEARRTFDAAKDFGGAGVSLRESWRNRLNDADRVTEGDILDLYRDLRPEVAATAVDIWKRRREDADVQLVMDHTVSDAAASLTKMLKDAQGSLDKIRNQNNKSATALAQAQVTALATQGEVLLSLAQLQAWDAARQSAENYRKEIQRREREEKRLVEERELELGFQKIRADWNAFDRAWKRRTEQNLRVGPRWWRAGRQGGQ